MKNLIYVVMLAFLCLVLLPGAADAGTGYKIQKKDTTSTTSTNGGTINYGTVWGNTDSNVFNYAWTDGLLINSAIMDYLQSVYGTGPIAQLLGQLSPQVTSELFINTTAGGMSGWNGEYGEDDTHYTQQDLVDMAWGLSIGERGGVYSYSSSSVTVGVSMDVTTSTTSVGHKIVTTTTNTTHNYNYTMANLSAKRWVSPIVLDMVGSGKLEASNGQYLPHKTMSLKNAMFVDIYDNGFPVAMEWVGPNDGLLVAPKADGSIDATCLFGTTGGFDNGFDKLSILDKNNDRQISGDELAGLCIWQDKNQNGSADKDELTTLKDAGITSLSLNQKSFVSSFVRNGKAFKMWDWWPSCMDATVVSAK
jgi:hypothetical protein